MNDNIFNKVESRTNIKKNTILDLAKKLQGENFKDKNVLNEVIDELSNLTGKNISNDKRNKIVNAIINDKVPKDIERKW